MTENKPKRAFRQKVIIPIVAAGALLIGALAGIVGWTLIDYFIANPEVEKRPNVVEIAGQPATSQPTPTKLRVDSGIQSGLQALENQLQHLHDELDSLSRKFDSFRKAAGVDGGRFTDTQVSLQELQSDLKKLQESVKNNYQSIKRITDSYYGREFVTLDQVQTLMGSIPKVDDQKIRDVVEKTLRDYRLTGPAVYGTDGTISDTVNNIRRDIDRIEQSMGDMRRDIDDLKRKVK